jgi:hypothetical protein
LYGIFYVSSLNLGVSDAIASVDRDECWGNALYELTDPMSDVRGIVFQHFNQFQVVVNLLTD